MVNISDKSKAYRETVVIIKLAEIGIPDQVIQGVLRHMRATNWFDMPKTKSILRLHFPKEALSVKGAIVCDEDGRLEIEFDFTGNFAKEYPII